MLHCLLKIFMIQLFLVGLIAVMTEAQETDPLYHFCSNVTTFARNSTYQKNRDTLLTHLASNAKSSTGFYNASVGQGPNEVNGLFLCRGDVLIADCRSCVASASQVIVQLCPEDKGAVVWRDFCLLRYSNESIFSTVDIDPAVFMWHTGNITTDQARFNQVLSSSLKNITTMAANASSGAKKFAVKQTDFNRFPTLYSLAQCTPDLSSSQCDVCLRQAIGQLPICCLNKMGGRVLFPSCNIRYEGYPFYYATAVPTAPPPPSLQPPFRAALPPPPISVTRPKGKSGISSVTIVAIVVPIAVSAVLFWLVFCFRSRRHTEEYHPAQEDDVANDDITTTESWQFDLRTLAAATNNFSADKKLGEGGFGEVYKGSLPTGKDIAVKKLARGSRQGAKEFKTEAALLAKLQHRNLVTLLGFCLEGGEKILVYEFVPNKSLDYFLFDPDKLRLLDWVRRYKIIGGIARGILYLHEDSRLRIIHRDLKASNILLDADMNPKISDFGTARIFGVEQTHETTSRIVGTYGYMAPEYAMHGMFSVKSDTYSFGVLVLEIICGKKNNSFYQTNGEEFLLSYVWKHWTDGTPLEVLDPTLSDRYSRNDVVRCMQIGLLCVQEDPADRPSMATVVRMLNSDTVSLPVPQRPAFFINSRTANGMPRRSSEQSHSTSNAIPCSIDSFITEIYPR